MISFIIPAHDEELLLPRTLRSIHEAASAAESGYEILVVDDASTDRTAALAAEHGARCISVVHRQISRTRNTGARAARGEVLVFVDADTSITPASVQEALNALGKGAVGGGALPDFDGQVPGWARVLKVFLYPMMRLFRATGGCFLFCTREAFLRSGGFDESLFCSEEIRFAGALKRLGRFQVLSARVLTSGRKLRTFRGAELMRLLALFAMRGPKMLRTRDGLDLWYGERRPDPDGKSGNRGDIATSPTPGEGA